LKKEDELNFWENVRRPPKKIIQPKTIKSKKNGCGTAPSNLVYTKKLPVPPDIPRNIIGTTPGICLHFDQLPGGPRIRAP
jgi:hypothetical protein